jgi:hypothetical protein
MLLGGIAYLAGIPFYALGEVKPVYHVIWHLFVLTGAILHWLDIYFNIVGLDVIVGAAAAVAAPNISNSSSISNNVTLM